MKNKIHRFGIDMLRLCFEVHTLEQLDILSKLELGERYDFHEFYLLRIEGKYYDYVFQIRFVDEHGEDKLFGEVKYGLNNSDEESNVHINGNRKVWIAVDNRVLYTGEVCYLDYIADIIGLEYHNVTCLDLCLDMTMNIARHLKRLIRCKDFNVILNGKRIRDRKEDRPEIIFTMSGDLNRDKYLTVNIKQKKALKDKSRGCSLIAYNKKAEIENSSSKNYISEHFGDPKSIYRLEVHLNNDDIKDYLNKTRTEFNIGTLFNEKVLFSIFYNSLERLIRFERNGKIIEWWDILEGVITTTPAKGAKDKSTANKTAS